MGFPKNIKALQTGIATRQNAAKAASDAASLLERQRKENQTIAEILNGLLTSWQDSDPGKYRDAYFFLDATLRKRVVVRTFLPEGTKIYQTRQEWDEYSQNRWRYRTNDYGVPYWYPVINLDVVGKGECSKCKSAQPVVEHYVQTDDSSDGDEWLKERFVLCLDCNSTTVLESKTSSSRF